MNIRLAKINDIEQINNLLYQVNLIHQKGRPDLFNIGKKYSDEQLTEIMNCEQSPIFVATNEQDKVVGYAFCQYKIIKNDNILKDIKTLYIDDLCVDCNERSKHIGTILFDFIKEYAKKNHFYNITLNVWACNEGAKMFYEKCGMTPQKTYMEEIL